MADLVSNVLLGGALILGLFAMLGAALDAADFLGRRDLPRPPSNVGRRPVITEPHDYDWPGYRAHFRRRKRGRAPR